MRTVWLGLVVAGLAACQTTTTTTPSVARPVAAPLDGGGVALSAEELRGRPSERRALINACLVEMGLPPMAEGLGAGTAPMEPEVARTFAACMARSA